MVCSSVVLRRPSESTVTLRANAQSVQSPILDLRAQMRCKCFNYNERKRVKGIEPSCAAWEAAVLPLNYTREEKKRIVIGDR